MALLWVLMTWSRLIYSDLKICWEDVASDGPETDQIREIDAELAKDCSLIPQKSDLVPGTVTEPMFLGQSCLWVICGHPLHSTSTLAEISSWAWEAFLFRGGFHVLVPSPTGHGSCSGSDQQMALDFCQGWKCSFSSREMRRLWALTVVCVAHP